MTRKPRDTQWPHPRSEEHPEAHDATEHQVDAMPEGEGRPGVDWMDFQEEGGGPTRRAVHLGVRELPNEADEQKE